ncbi:MAG: efflux RND transporter periplasmic adaptor subunit [Prevotella sp.]|nr:efflux RND transporter periplasmic adaptor subunit [Prevotella sp.]
MKTKIIIGLLAVLTIAGCSGKEESGVKAPTKVKTEIVGSEPPSDGAATFVGTVEEREATAVSFTGMGVVRRVLVSEGQHVSRGQLLAEMDDTQARNLLAGAEAQVAQAEDALERYSQLHENGSMTEAQWVEVQSKVAQARASLEVARKNVADCRLTAPVGGIIGRKMVGAGETALPSQAVVTILDVTSVKVRVAVPESEISRIGAGTPAYIKVEAVGRSFEGGRIEKGVVADALTHTYDVRISVDNRERLLLPGMVASVRFTATMSQSTELALPVTAVQKRAGGQLFVWTVSADSTAHRTAVSIGQTTGNHVAITEGLTGGERIVTEGYQKLSEGSRVTF